MAAPFTDQFFRAIADYALKFPTLGDLGGGNPPSTWMAEYNRVRQTAFASVLLTSNSQEGGGTAGGQRNFSQEILVDALHCRRFDLDNTYILPAHLAGYPSALIRRRNARPGSMVIRFDNA
jgi:hypothetical protein